MNLAFLFAQALTGLRLAFVPVLWWAALYGRWKLALFMFFFAAVTDVLDGYVARKFNCITPFGAAFDPFVDKVLTLSLVTIMYCIPTILPAPFWFFILMICKEVLLLLGALYFGLVKRDVFVSAAVPGKISGVIQGFFTLYWLFCVAFWPQVLVIVGLKNIFALIWWGNFTFYTLMVLVLLSHGAALLFYSALLVSQRKKNRMRK